jgi:hypothetical protein
VSRELLIERKPHMSLTAHPHILQRKHAGEFEPVTVPPIVHEVLRSPGQPLDTQTRAFFEPRFGYDFTKVRVHSDAKATNSARAMNAQAYTVEQQIVFDAGGPSLSSLKGKRLLAHELTHVIQQHTKGLPDNVSISQTGDTYEVEADRMAEHLNQMPANVKSFLCTTEGKVRKQARVDKTGDSSQIKGEVAAIIQKIKLGDPHNPTREEWEYFAKALNKSQMLLDPLQVKLIEDYFSNEVDMCRMTFETITEDQRIIFLTIQPALREELRKKALPASRLYRSITQMHLDQSKDVVSQEIMP